tara:strand:- start:25 stop:645 length:621 start_codon:yes stop_codon:yes gene_type:complete
MNKNIKTINKINEFFNKIPIIYYFIPFVLHIISTNFLLQNTPHEYAHKEPLYDIIINNIPDYSKYHYLVNLIMLILIIPFIIDPKLKYFISIFKYFSIIIFLRVITTSVTILPACELNCCKMRNDLMHYIFGHCNDKIFSGHTSLSLILVYLIYKYKLVSNNLLYLFIGIQIFIALLLIITKGHYTIDVLLAYFITGTVLLLISDL